MPIIWDYLSKTTYDRIIYTCGYKDSTECYLNLLFLLNYFVHDIIHFTVGLRFCFGGVGRGGGTTRQDHFTHFEPS